MNNANPNLIPTQVPDRRGFMTTRNKLPDAPSEANVARLDGLRADVARSTIASPISAPPLMNTDKEFAGKNVKVVLTYLDEGLNGEYDDSDDSDIPLARVDVFVNKKIADQLGETETADGEWYSVSGSSICTRIDARADEGSINNWLGTNGSALDSAMTASVGGEGGSPISEFIGWAEGATINTRTRADDLLPISRIQRS